MTSQGIILQCCMGTRERAYIYSKNVSNYTMGYRDGVKGKETAYCK